MTRAIVVAGGILCAAVLSPAARTETEWKLEQVGSRLTSLSGVWGTSSQNVFAVGGRGVILHFDGSRWSRQGSGTGKDLEAVWAGSQTEAFAVGLDGVILHFDGHRWEREKSGTSKTLLAVWGASPADVYAVGRGGTILHFDGRSWTRQPSPTRYDLTAVWGSSASDVHAAGDHGTILHSDGRRWTHPAASFGFHWRFAALGGTSAGNVYAGGSRRPSGQLRDESSRASSFGTTARRGSPSPTQKRKSWEESGLSRPTKFISPVPRSTVSRRSGDTTGKSSGSSIRRAASLRGRSGVRRAVRSSSRERTGSS